MFNYIFALIKYIRTSKRLLIYLEDMIKFESADTDYCKDCE